MLLKREYLEGAVVDVGQVLFRIDPRTYEAALARANAQAAQAKATLIQAEENYNRQVGLAAQKVATQKSLEDAIAGRDQARANVQSTEADVQTAKLNLEFTIIKAPVKGPDQPGVAGRGHADPGAADTAHHDHPARSGLRQLHLHRLASCAPCRRSTRSAEELFDPDRVKVELQFGDGATYPEPGTVDTRSRTVDPRTGTILTRAIFPNHDGGLLPGQFVRVKMTGITMPNAIVVPKAAISQGPLGPYVYVVEPDLGGARAAGPAVPRAARRLDRAQGPGAGDRIVVDGVIRVRPGNVVKPVPVAAPANAKAPRCGRPAGGRRQAVISKFFIDRPVFASVLSIVIVLAGLVAMRALPISQYPQIVPPEVVVSATYPGRHRREHRRHRRRPARAADQRRRAHDLHAVDLDRLGHDEPHGHLRDRHQSRPERHQRQQSRAARPAAAAGGSRPPGAGRAEALDRDPAGADHVLAGRALRHDLHQQLRAGERARRDPPPAGRGRRLAVRRLGLFDAHLAQARQARPVQSDAVGHRRRGARAEPAVRRRPLRRGADEQARRSSPIR